MKLSVIIPLYNSEQTIEKCVLSVLSSISENDEVVLVNDGSLDGTANLALRLAGDDDRIKYFEEPNSGPATARKKGIFSCSGDYVGFVDSDDFVDILYFKNVLPFLTKYAPDVCFLNYLEESNCKTKVICNQIKFSDNIFDDIILKIAGFEKSYLSSSLWNKIFKKDVLLNNINLIDEGIRMGEDFLLLVACCLSSKSILSYNNFSYYHYCSNPNQITKTFKDYTLERSAKEFECLRTIFDKYNMLNRFKHCYYLFFTQVWNALAYLYQDTTLSQMEKKSISKKIHSSVFFKKVVFKYHPRHLKILLKKAILVFGLEGYFKRKFIKNNEK